MHSSTLTAAVAALLFASIATALPAAATGTTTKISTTTKTTTKATTKPITTSSKITTTTPKPITTTTTKSTTKSTTTSSSTTGVPQPTCKVIVANYDEFPNAGGKFQDLPGGGYDYLGLNYEPGQFGYVSQGRSFNGDFTTDDRPVDDPIWGQLQDIVVHSGQNALIPSADGFVRSFSTHTWENGTRWINPQSMWIAPEISGKPFSFRVDCDSYWEKDKKSKIWDIPTLPDGQMYKLEFPSDWLHMWRCTLGPTNLQQFVMDDFQYCMYEIPYNTYPW